MPPFVPSWIRAAANATTSTTTTTSTFQAVCRANLGILGQKLQLMNVLKTTFGQDKAKQMYQQVCPIVHASVGQHIRHSMDHMELVAQLANSLITQSSSSSSSSSSPLLEIHYDVRERGGTDEYDLDAAQERVQRVVDIVSLLSNAQDNGKDNTTTTPTTPIQACFMLSGDPQEFYLPSTLTRELGFSAHHAIHHMAMVKIIALETLQIPPTFLSPDFGRAPSTIVHDQLAS